MNFDDFAPLIFFLIYVAFMLLKGRKAKKKKAQAAPPDQAGTAKKERSSQKQAKKKGGLFNLIDLVKAELERAAREARKKEVQEQTRESGDLPDWSAETGREESTLSRDFWSKEPATETGVEHEPPYWTEPAAEVPPLPSQVPRDDSDITAKELVPGPIPGTANHARQVRTRKRSTRKQPVKLGHLSKDRLKEAVILSEILAKPVGMRE